MRAYIIVIGRPLFDALIQLPLSKRERLIVLALLGFTADAGANLAPVSHGRLATYTGIDRANVVATINRLQARKIITKQHQDGRQILGVNTSFKQWLSVN